jgi:Flp pilus assembly protein TadD
MRNILSAVLFLLLVVTAPLTGHSQSLEAREITGQVRLGGQPAPAGVTVVLQIVAGQYTAPTREPELVRTVTDARGRFVFNRLETLGQSGGREFFAVSAKSPGFGWSYQVVDLKLSAREDVSLVLQKESSRGDAAAPGVNIAATVNARPPSNAQAQQALDRAQELLFRKHDPAASVDEFKKVVKSDPWYGPGYVLLGLAYMQTQRWSDAQLAFTQASKVEPGNAQAFLGLGSALNEQHDYTGAQKALEHSLDLNPDSAEAHYELARSLGAQGKWQEAGPHVSRALEINPDYPGPHALMGNVYLEAQNPAFALTEFREYLRLDPQGSLAPAVKQIIPEIEKAIAQANEKQP